MSMWGTEPASGNGFRNRRLGVALALLAAMYIAAVIGFIVVY